MLIKNLLAPKKVLFGLSIGWTILIAVLCLVSFGDLPSTDIKSADKYVHITLHFVFTLLWGLYVSIKINQIKVSQIARIVVFSLCYGLLIEGLQETLTETRHADVYDVLANFGGAALAFLVLLLIKKSKTHTIR